MPFVLPEPVIRRQYPQVSVNTFFHGPRDDFTPQLPHHRRPHGWVGSGNF